MIHLSTSNVHSHTAVHLEFIQRKHLSISFDDEFPTVMGTHDAWSLIEGDAWWVFGAARCACPVVLPAGLEAGKHTRVCLFRSSNIHLISDCQGTTYSRDAVM